VAGTYYAQAREYQADAGRFQGMDLIPGIIETPFSINRYSYCYNKPIMLSDLNGKKPISNNIPTENKLEIGIGLGVGGGVSISWEDAACND
jgi:RHS repeat-associated protein